jgi:hypothetical protein
VVLAPDHVHALPRKRVPRQELRRHMRYSTQEFDLYKRHHAAAQTCPTPGTAHARR